MKLRLASFRSLLALTPVLLLCGQTSAQVLGDERAILRHLNDGEEFQLSTRALLRHGRELFVANWTVEEGGGRPMTDGAGGPLADPLSPLVGMRSFNRISAPDANSCWACHNAPRGIAGGGGDFVANVFVLAQRFDFSTFDHADLTPGRGAVDETGQFVTQSTIGNSRASVGMFGAGFIEMLARQMTSDLQALRDTLPASGGSVALTSKGVSFGTLVRNGAGVWDTSQVEGLGALSTGTNGGVNPPNLIVRPFHQAGAVVSLRQFSNNAFNHHHGIQSVERFGSGDTDNDTFANEMTTADTTAVSVFQATLPVPGRVIPNDPVIEQAVRLGEQVFVSVGCADCHQPCLPLDGLGRFFAEPNPYNPTGNLRPSDAYVSQHGTFSIDLSWEHLPRPRLKPASNGVTYVPAFTDLKLHDITSGPSDPNREPLDMQHPAGSAGFVAGNSRFLTKKLWGCADEPPYFHHGQFTTLRQAIEAHAGEAAVSKSLWDASTAHERDCVIEFLKTLRILEQGTQGLVVDEQGRPRTWVNQAWSCGG